jgi:hypothetical protein
MNRFLPMYWHQCRTDNTSILANHEIHVPRPSLHRLTSFRTCVICQYTQPDAQIRTYDADNELLNSSRQQLTLLQYLFEIPTHSALEVTGETS